MRRTKAPALVLALLVPALLAGCGDAAPGPAGGGEGDGEPTGSTGAEAPAWSVGQFWSYEASDGGAFDLVVAVDEGPTWQVLPDDPAVAYFDWSPGLSFMGTVRKADLAGKQGSGFVAFFDWPLEDGKTWTTPWDDAPRAVRASAEADGTWTLRAYLGTAPDGDLFAEYQYDPAVGYFDRLTYFNETSQEPVYTLQRVAHGDAYAGSVHRYTAVDEALAVSQAGPGAPQGTFAVADEQELQIDFSYDCGTSTGNLLAGLRAPQEDGSAQPVPADPLLNQPEWGIDLACPGGGSDAGRVVLGAVPGSWRMDAVVGNADGAIDVTVSLRTYETHTF